MHEALKVATTICTTMLRNGYDAHIVNAPLQQHLLETSDVSAVDIACEPDIEVLGKLFPSLVTVEEGPLMAQLEEGYRHQLDALYAAAAASSICLASNSSGLRFPSAECIRTLL